MHGIHSNATTAMLRVLKERSRSIPGEEERRIPLLLNPRDIQAAKLYTPEEISALLEGFDCNVPFRFGKLIVNFSEKDAISEYMSWNDYWLNWEYNQDKQSVPALILNFAGMRQPVANQYPIAYGQEKSLLENSTLLATLENPQAKAFYRFQQAAPDSLRSDAMLLSPFVEFFSVNGIQQEKSQLAAVLSAVAPRCTNDPEAQINALARRIRAMLLIAAKEGYKRLILGAWGCGAAGNDPELVASLFEGVLREEVRTVNASGKETLHSWHDFFDSITFAVPPSPASEAFRNHFSDFYRAEREEKFNKIRAEIAADREKYLSAIRGSLIGGAVGDALGYPVEFMSLKAITARYGEGGIRSYEKDFETDLALISDDTQMTLFTATGMLYGDTRAKLRGISGPPESYINMAYTDWYYCQSRAEPDGMYWWTSWLRDLPEMYARRAPGGTCLSALQSGGNGSIKEPINHSKGCGGVMRIAPIPLFFREPMSRDHLKYICLTAAKAAALTHGHPLGYMPAAALAQIISRAAFGGCPKGDDLYAITEECRELMQEMFAGNEYLPAFIRLLDQTVELAGNNLPDRENIRALGEGWVAEEALAVALYCCLRHPNDFSEAVIAAVNHSGDSDSTGAIAGNIMGAYLGDAAIDPKWLQGLELRSVIDEISTDLCDRCRMSEYSEYCDPEWERKYIYAGRTPKE